MMTTSEEKHLAEFAKKFLPGQFERLRARLCISSHGDLVSNESMLFEDTTSAPILMHLAKREMIEKGFDDITEVYAMKKHHISFGKSSDPAFGIIPAGIDSNEFIAFWSAVEQAVKGGD